jgi:hypothetical protein
MSGYSHDPETDAELAQIAGEREAARLSPAPPHWSELLEPVAITGPDGPQAAALVSIAVSLKRIADTMDGTATGICITETLIGGQAHGR